MVLKGANTMIYQDLTLYITSFVLLRIYKQYCRLANKPQPFLLYTHQFTTIMELSYIYRIEVSFIIYKLLFDISIEYFK